MLVPSTPKGAFYKMNLSKAQIEDGKIKTTT
jgi:hypothetical protein